VSLTECASFVEDIR